MVQTNSECLELAERYLKRATEVTDPVLKQSLIVAAERWKRLAADFESENEWWDYSELLSEIPLVSNPRSAAKSSMDSSTIKALLLLLQRLHSTQPVNRSP